MKYIITIMTTCLFASCIKEKITSYQAYVINKSGHTIEIRPYFKGIVPTANIVKINNNDSFKIGDGSDRGLVGIGAGFSSKYLSGEDSLRVIFDNTYAISHYVKTPASFAPKYYLYTT